MDTINEQWKVIRSVDTGKHKYAVSTLGRILNFTTNNIVMCKVKKETHYSYKCLVIMIKGKKKYYKVHRLVAVHFLNNYKNKTHIKFTTNDRTNCSIFNIKWSDKSEIMTTSKVGGNNKSGHRNITKLECGRFKVRKHYRGSSIARIFNTLEVAIEFRDNCDVEKIVNRRKNAFNSCV